MFDEYEPAPFDSYDLYAMGLRAPRCNGCKFAQVKYELGERAIIKGEGGWTTIFELTDEPLSNPGVEIIDGRHVKFRISFMSTAHSDECYDWKPLERKPVRRKGIRELLAPKWTDANCKVWKLTEVTDSHLLNIYRHLRRRIERAESYIPHVTREIERRGMEVPND